MFVLVGFLVLPPLVDQASTLWQNLPQYSTASESAGALQADDAPRTQGGAERAGGSSGNAVGAVLVALWGVIGGLFGVITVLI